jgi:hypothetical protein
VILLFLLLLLLLFRFFLLYSFGLIHVFCSFVLAATLPNPQSMFHLAGPILLPQGVPVLTGWEFGTPSFLHIVPSIHCLESDESASERPSNCEIGTFVFVPWGALRDTSPGQETVVWCRGEQYTYTKYKTTRNGMFIEFYYI